jgi:hypothetical protein
VIDKEELSAWYSSLGKKGGKGRAKKYNKKQLSDWAKLGGRPKGSKNKKKGAK